MPAQIEEDYVAGCTSMFTVHNQAHSLRKTKQWIKLTILSLVHLSWIKMKARIFQPPGSGIIFGTPGAGAVEKSYRNFTGDVTTIT